jgi:hypothetical protein
MSLQKNQEEILKANYRLLSEMEELFPKNSKHKAALFINYKMKQILKDLTN